MSLEPGSRFDRYRIDAKLGEGGMGCVYRAYDERLQRSVALKVLQVDAGADTADSKTGQGAAQLLREARAAAALDHPNAIAVFDVGTELGTEAERARPYIAMELIEGRNLRAFVGRPEPDLAERVRWLTDAARAVAAAHRRGLVHRDIKPENVMVRHEDGVVKVLDFGIARRTSLSPSAATQGEPASGTLTGGGAVVGTPFYMAPEQMRGEPVDGRADQFSWGVLAYELLSGRLPWGTEDQPLVIVSNILTRAPPAIETIAPHVPENVAAVISRALAKDAIQRFPSMDDLVRQLDSRAPLTPSGSVSTTSEDFVSAPTVRSTKTSLASSTQRPSSSLKPRRSWRSTLTGVLVALALATAGLGLLRHQGAQARPSDTDAAAASAHDRPPSTTTPEALAAYKDALQKFRDGDSAQFVPAFERAVDIDPRLAPALLRLARAILFARPSEARDCFRRAIQLRNSLSAQDRLLLDAFEPLFQHEPADLGESRQRLFDLAVRFPNDAELLVLLAWTDHRMGAPDSALDEFERVIALDPGSGNAFLGKAIVLAAKGDFAAAITVTEECDRVAPDTQACRRQRTGIELMEGHCNELLDDADKTILSDPSAPGGYVLVAEALADTGSPAGTVREALVKARARINDADNAGQAYIQRELDIPLLDGSFDEAKHLLAMREATIAASAQELDHATVAWNRIQLALETGDEREAAEIAWDFRTRSRIWSLPADVKDWIRQDSRLPILALLVRDKRIPRDELDAARSTAASSMADPRAPGLWLGAYAWPASTPLEARAAFAALARFEPLPPIWEISGEEFFVGNVFQLAGHTDDALPHLVRATNACDMLVNTFEHLHASLLLGQALESKSDIPGACKAYRVVLSHWGNAKPRSRTADAARARVKALSCP